VILGVAAALVVVSAGTFLTLRSRATQEDQAAGRLAEANALFWQGDYARSQQISKQVAEQYASTPSGRDAHRLMGDAAYWSGDFKTAVSEYQRYLELDKTGLLANAVRRSLAYALESAQQYAQAVPVYDQLVGVFDRESSAEFLMAGARCEVLAHQPAEATRRLQRLVDEFGDASLAGRARSMMGEIAAR
jgi:tetratricopeptide (TPR) repeat protein